MIYFRLPVLPDSPYYIRVFVLDSYRLLGMAIKKLYGPACPPYPAMFHGIYGKSFHLGTMMFSKELLDISSLQHETTHAACHISRCFKTRMYKALAEPWQNYEDQANEELFCTLTQFLLSSLVANLKYKGCKLTEPKPNYEREAKLGISYYSKAKITPDIFSIVGNPTWLNCWQNEYNQARSKQ